MTDEQPEPFFLRVWLKALAVASGDAIAFKPKQDYAAALAIQRDFAEREAELVGALRHVTECLVVEMGNLADEDEYPDEDLAPVVGVKYARQVIAARLRIRQARTALKSREAGHG